MKNTNIFLIQTEYHLLLTSIIILDNFNETSSFRNIIIFNFSSKRLTQNFNVNLLPAELIGFSGQSKQITLFIKQLMPISPGRFFLFQAGNPFNLYFAHNAFKLGYLICLGQDGFGVYAKWDKHHEFLSTIKDSIKSYRLLYRAALFLPPKYTFKPYRFGHISFIKEVWLTNPDFFTNKYNKRIRVIGNPGEKKYKSILEQVFLFDGKTLTTNENVVFYVNQPFLNDTHVDEEIKFLHSLLSNLKGIGQFVIKIHQNTPEKTKLRYKLFNDVLIIEEKYPAELYINHLKNSIIIAGWSTALLTNNPLCNMYYIYPIFSKDKNLSQVAPINPTGYIKVVDDYKKIQFPSSM